MKVCCIPRDFNEEPHENEMSDDFHKASGSSPDLPTCKVCGMPLVFENRFVAIQSIGKGGFGRTFLARDIYFLDGTRVIKQLNTNKLDFSRYVDAIHKSFQDEKNNLDQLNHAQIPKVYSYFKVAVPPDSRHANQGNVITQTFFYMVQAYVKGKDIQKELEEGKSYKKHEILIFLKQLLEIIQYIHTRQRPIIHLDIKPSNIIHSIQDNLYHLIDFGASRRIIADLTQEVTGGRVGFISPAFSPPEQQNGNTDFTSDLYALAMTCVCLLTGKTVTYDSTDSEDLRFLGLPDNQARWQQYADVSPQLAQILNKMLQPKPSDRYQSAKAVLRDLRPLIQPSDTHLISSVPPEPPETVINPDISRKKMPGIEPPSPKSLGLLELLTRLGLLSSLGMGILAIVVFIFHKNSYEPSPIPPLKTFATIFSVKPAPPNGDFKFGGATTWSPIIDAFRGDIEGSYPDFDLSLDPPTDQQNFDPECKNIKGPSSENGISRLIARKLDFALSSKRLTDCFIKKAARQNINLKVIPVASSYFVVAVNPNLKIDKLTRSQYEKITRGEIKNWKEVGGPDLKITIYSSSEKYQDASYEYVKTPTEAFKKIKANLGGLHEATAAIVVKQCSVKALSLGDGTNEFVSPYKEPFSVVQKKCSKLKKNDSNPNTINPELLKATAKYPYSPRELSVVVVDEKEKKDSQLAGEAFANMLRSDEKQKKLSELGYIQASK